MTKHNWFSVDKEGLASQLERRGKSFAVLELLQNALDEPGVTEVDIELTAIPNRQAASLKVTDNAPDGFADLSHSYTFFAPSTKRSNPEQRGRFNSGEKMVLAICNWAKVKTTTGSVTFHQDGTRTKHKENTEAGSIFAAEIRFTRADIEDTLRVLRQCIIPLDVDVKVNGELLPIRAPLRMFDAVLPTEVDFRPTQRRTTVSLYKPAGIEPMIYEMGIPVVSYEGEFDVDVAQRIPLNTDRDNVTPAYRRKLWAVTLEHSVDLLDKEGANASWVREALPHVSDAVAKEALVKRFGERTAIFDPSDQEAGKRLQDKGYTIIYGRSLSQAEHEVVKKTQTFLPAGQILPSGVRFKEGGVPPVPQDDWTPAMRRLADYARAMSKHLIGFEVRLDYYKLPTRDRWAGCWLNGHVSINLTNVGKAWVEKPNQVLVDSLLIHEFAHHYASDHFTDSFIRACCDLGAKRATWEGKLSMQEPADA